MRPADTWKDYELLDATDGNRLERWGETILIRPDPQVVWKTPKQSPLWAKADAVYHRSNQGGGEWEYKRRLPEKWKISCGEGEDKLTLIVSPTGFKHTGVFPEQAVNWAWYAKKIRAAGRPIKVLLADEVDAYKASAGKEGDPVMLAEQRQTTYWDYKTVLVSTPTDKNNSRILDEFNASTQEEWTVPCPNCGFYQPFVWDNMVFDKDKWPEGGVQYRCAECGCLDNEYRWKKNSLKGKWHAEHPERAVRGFHMNKIGSTLCGWDKIVEDFIAADLDAQRGDYEKMQVFVNTDLGLPWEEPGEAVEANNLLDRREFYEAEVPDGVVYLTAGVDTQDNRFEAEVGGWGIGRESWGIRYQRIYGDLKRGQVWADLDEFLSRTWKKKDGTELSLRSVCMDSGGHFPDQVIRFCKEREERHIWAIKGRGGMDVPYLRNPTQNNRVKGELFTLGVDTGKNHVLARLKVLIKGPNYCHFPAAEDSGYDENYFKMLTAEHKVTRWKSGRKVERWELKDPAQKRNEAFDVRNYATAALEISNPPGLEIPGEDAQRPAQQRQYRRRRSGGI